MLKISATALALLGAWAGFAGQPASATDKGSPLQLSIDKVIQTFNTDVDVCDGFDFITITGMNFDNGMKPSKKWQPPVVTTPVVKLGGEPLPLELCAPPTATEIVAKLPDPLAPGDYRIEVVTGKSKLQSDD